MCINYHVWTTNKKGGFVLLEKTLQEIILTILILSNMAFEKNDCANNFPYFPYRFICNIIWEDENKTTTMTTSIKGKLIKSNKRRLLSVINSYVDGTKY